MKRVPGKRGVRLSDLAMELGLSASTVSRALSGNPAIRLETRTAVQRAAAEMGYAAPRQRWGTQRTGRMIGLAMSDLHNRFMTLLLEYIHDALLESGYRVTLIVDAMDCVTDAAALSAFKPLIDGYLDGLILGSVTLDAIVVAELRRLGVPLVLVARSLESSNVDIVEADNVRGGAEAARHLYELGHRKIGLAMGPANTSTSRDRAGGALQYFQSVGLPKESIRLVYDAYTSEAGYSCTVQMLAETKPVTAILAGDDSIAFGVLDAAKRMGIGVPARLSVIGFDDVPLAGSPLIGLTTIQHPAKEMARTAVRRILDRIKNGPLAPVTRDVFPIQLVRRDTTAVAPGPEPS
jgi:LacI family transcriptional regulator